MSPVEFEPWPKIARLNRNITITEKIDGTNAAVVILKRAATPETAEEGQLIVYDEKAALEAGDVVSFVHHDGADYVVFAQSRNKFITPKSDNHGFAGWVERNAKELVAVLGEGRHFGEWWGSGIQRKYGLTGSDKRFSLFNAVRWENKAGLSSVPGLGVVPIIYRGPYAGDGHYEPVSASLQSLRDLGSMAAPGFMDPEGVVIWHEAARTSFKVTLKNDEAPKGAQE